MNLNDLLDYICQHYSEVIEIFRLLDTLVQSLITNQKPLPPVDLDDLRKRIKTWLKQK